MNFLLLSTITALLTGCGDPASEGRTSGAPEPEGRAVAPAVETPAGDAPVEEGPTEESSVERVTSPTPVVTDSYVEDAASFDHDHRAWTALLEKHVAGANLDYREMAEDRGQLDAYLEALASVDVQGFSTWTEAQRYAYWINAYNAHVVALVLDHYPVASINDIGTEEKPVWKKVFIELPAAAYHEVSSKLSLDSLEHQILRPKFKDARVHAAVNCASESCPPLLDEAFTAAELDRQLDGRVRAWLADPARNRFDKEAGTLHVSAIFEWFADDFRRDAGSVEAWIARYAPEPAAAWIVPGKVRLETRDYSWKLNDVPRPSALGD